jgi:hypothetical protein
MYFQAKHPAPFTACCFVKQNGMNTFTAFAGSTLLHYKPRYITVYSALCAAGRYARQIHVWRLSIGAGIRLRGVADSQKLLKCNTARFHVHYSISSFEFLKFPTASSNTSKSNTFASFPYVDCCRSPLSLQIFRDATALGRHSSSCLNFSTKFSHLTVCFLYSSIESIRFCTDGNLITGKTLSYAVYVLWIFYSELREALSSFPLTSQLMSIWNRHILAIREVNSYL